MWRALAILVFGTVAGACLLTPPVYSLLLTLWPEFPWPYSRVFDRVCMVLALGLIVWQRKHFDLAALRQYFSGARSTHLKLFGIGFAASIGASSLILIYMLQTGQLYWKGALFSAFAWKLIKVVPAAILISLIEESFFRVLVFQGIKRLMPVMGAALLCSVCYSIVHFIIPDKTWVYPGLGLSTGFIYLASVLGDIFEPSVVRPFLGLMVVGGGLCCLIERRKSLALCIGLHTGWVVALKLATMLAPITDKSVLLEEAVRRYYLVAEPFAWLIIVVALLLADRLSALFEPIPKEPAHAANLSQ